MLADDRSKYISLSRILVRHDVGKHFSVSFFQMINLALNQVADNFPLFEFQYKWKARGHRFAGVYMFFKPKKLITRYIHDALVIRVSFQQGCFVSNL